MDNKDLEELEKEIVERKKTEVAEVPAVPVISFEKANNIKKEESKDTATQLVENAFSQAIVNVVANDKSVQEDLLSSAEKVIKNKTNAIEERADQEEKAAYFNNRKGACECFGYNEATTEKWAVHMMNFWHNIMTAIWLFVGFFTFAPITFVAKKITVIFKKSWVAILLAILLYLLIVVGIPILTQVLKK